MTEPAPFDPDLLRFLADLKRHNNRDWFEKNRARYEHVYRDAFASFITGFSPRLARISPHLVADPRPTGGSVMRIYRDTRFSKDKSPYRTYTVVHFGHRDAGEGMAPGLFLFVSPDEISGGGGIWHPEPTAASKIRSAIASQGQRWDAATASPAFRKRFEFSGESLKRPPPGFPKDHPRLDDLRRKDFVASTEVPSSRFTSKGFPSFYEELAREVSPLLRFLCEALGLPF